MLSPPLSRLAPEPFVTAARRALAEPPAGVDPWFLSYCGDLANDRGLATYVRAKWQLVSIAGGVKGRDVVDAGSGFGLGANLMAHWGARAVYAIELHRPMVESHGRILARDFPSLRNVHPVRGDASRLPVRDRSADLLISNEAISHYFDVDAFLDEAARVVRPGGVLVISDGNNGANPGIRAHTEEVWERWEVGPHGEIGAHQIEETMTERRARIIRELFPDLPADKVSAYAETTSGLERLEIERAIRAHREGGPAPDSRYRRGVLPRDPDWGYVVERLFDPPSLAREIERRGFRARAIPHFGGARNDLLLAANEVLRRLPTFRYARAFKIVAIRT